MRRLSPHVATSRIVGWASDQPERHAFVLDCLARHHRHDWGDLDPHDWDLNDRAVGCQSGRVLSTYVVPAELAPLDASLWIITDDLESADAPTTILGPSDY